MSSVRRIKTRPMAHVVRHGNELHVDHWIEVDSVAEGIQRAEALFAEAVQHCIEEFGGATPVPDEDFVLRANPVEVQWTYLSTAVFRTSDLVSAKRCALRFSCKWSNHGT